MKHEEIDKIMQRKNIKYTDFLLVYPFSTENFKDLADYLQLKDKTILTTCGSSDQVLDMTLYDAKSITAFDINPLTEYYYYLKKAFLLSDLDLEEYFRFFSSLDNTYVFYKETFKKIKDYLDEEYYDFWNHLFTNYSSNNIRNNEKIFSLDEREIYTIENSIAYLNEENFNKLKSKIDKIDFKFINSDIKELPNILTEEYDLIYLSNIVQYTDMLYGSDISMTQQLKNYKELILKLSDYLTYQGEIMAGYIYSVKINNCNKAIFNRTIRHSVFKEHFYYILFQSISTLKKKIVMNEQIYDGALMYKKNLL